MMIEFNPAEHDSYERYKAYIAANGASSIKDLT